MKIGFIGLGIMGESMCENIVKKHDDTVDLKKALKQIEEGTLKHTKKPDLDNLGKAVLDALNEIAFTDDSHITKLTLVKRYSAFPGIGMTITEDVN